MGQQLSEIGVLRRSVQEMQRGFAEIVRIADRTSIGLQELSGFGLHFRQMKREQLRLSEKLDMISRETDSLAGVLQLRDQVQREHQDEFKEIVVVSRSLQEWRSRITAVYSDAGHLFESEPIRELIDRFGPRPAYAAESPARSGRRMRPSQKSVGARLQR